MRQYIISEERLKMLLKHERELCYARAYSTFYRPSEKELEVTDDDLKPFDEIKEREIAPDIEFACNFADEKDRFPVDVVCKVKFRPDFSVLNND